MNIKNFYMTKKEKTKTTTLIGKVVIPPDKIVNFFNLKRTPANQ